MSTTATRGRGRPPVGPAIEIRLPPDLLAEIDRRADALGITRAAYLRDLLSALFQEPPKR